MAQKWKCAACYSVNDKTDYHCRNRRCSMNYQTNNQRLKEEEQRRAEREKNTNMAKDLISKTMMCTNEFAHRHPQFSPPPIARDMQRYKDMIYKQTMEVAE
ncbi:unnamed protein product, partial [Prorocentrum cordatum]